eukprot:TRINITY_DN37677_c0_g1_i1.p1 TRINITY_DN37677_c0_g1~~TRINITY_DN37677_c0_g1_i1.p1  ORF type:complete len:319 (-),score=40.50 TRINITY_DN37677_c0_g1_i1:277-1161(-)
MALADDVAAFLLEEDSMDAEFVVNHGATVRAHRLVLMMRSEVFRSMFTHDLVEKRTGRIMITDASLQAVQLFVRFLYTDEVDDKANLGELLVLAEKYAIPYLVEKVQRVLMADCDIDKLPSLLELCCAHRLPHLEERLAFMVQNQAALHSRKDIESMCAKCPQAALKLIQLLKSITGIWIVGRGEMMVREAEDGLVLEITASNARTFSARLADDGEWYVGRLVDLQDPDRPMPGSTVQLRSSGSGQILVRERKDATASWMDATLGRRKLDSTGKLVLSAHWRDYLVRASRVPPR